MAKSPKYEEFSISFIQKFLILYSDNSRTLNLFLYNHRFWLLRSRILRNEFLNSFLENKWTK